MDTKLIQQYGEEIRCYRLRTARQKKRMRYKDFDKQLIKLFKEERDLRKQINNLGFKELKPPVQKGWIRHFILRDDVVNGPHAVFFENILKKINTYEYHWRRDFKIKIKRFGKKFYIVKEQQLRKLWEYRFRELEFTDAERQFFYEVWEPDYDGKWHKRICFKEPWRFVLVIRPNMIDKERIVDGALESRKKQIENYLEKNDLDGRQMRLLFGSWKRWSTNKEFEKYNEVSLFKNMSLLQILDLIQCE